MPPEYLKTLNPAQREAVENIFGPTLVIAGPGTGKTQMLTSRIANILQKTDTSASNILCLTFTESGAVEMRNRLQRWIGNEAYRVKITTFHGFCESVMQDFPEFFEDWIIDFEIADDLDKAQLFRAVIDAKHWEFFRPFHDRYSYQRAFLGAVSSLKREYFNPEKLREVLPAEAQRMNEDPKNFYLRDSKYGKKGEMKAGVEQKIKDRIGKMKEFCDVWEAYETLKQKNKWYDFDDQIGWAVAKISEDEALKAELQEQYQFILVDEYQDTNESQNEILWNLTDFFDNPNIFAVGDGDQSIFRFQGASLENIQAFGNRFSEVKNITLTQNYRSSQKVLDTAFASILQNKERLTTSTALTASGPNKDIEGHIERGVFVSRSSEIVFLGKKIQDLLKSGMKASQIAVLVRENREVKEVATYLQKFDIPVSLRVYEDVFSDVQVQWIVQMMKIIESPHLDTELYELLHAPFWGIEGSDLMGLAVEARGSKTQITTLLQKCLGHRREDSKSKSSQTRSAQTVRGSEFETLTAVGANNYSPLQNAWKFFTDMRKNYFHVSPSVLAEKCFEESGMRDFVMDESNEARLLSLQKIKKFFEWCKQPKQENGTWKEVLEKIDLHQELGIPLYPDPLPGDRNSVQVMTAHKSKGMEFEVVFLPGCLDRVWGNKRSMNLIPLPEIFHSDHDPNEDERRLFFVALTRAKTHIFLSYAEQDFSGRERSPSQFWHEIPDDLVIEMETDTIESEAQGLLPVLFAAGTVASFTAPEKDILKQLVQKFVWSASSLQNYLDCPQKFLYQNLLKVPVASKKIFGFGSAMHRALELFVQNFQSTGDFGNVEDLQQLFESHLKHQNLTNLEFEESLNYGKKLLQPYFEKNEAALRQSQSWQLEAEFSGHIENIAVYGKVDKIEFSDDKKQGLIVDYKSGKPKKIQHGDRFWRQLVFYDLLARETKPGWEVKGLELEFLTPNPKGEFIKTLMEVSDEDREQVISELKEAHEKVMNLDFPLVENKEGDEEVDYWQGFGRG